MKIEVIEVTNDMPRDRICHCGNLHEVLDIALAEGQKSVENQCMVWFATVGMMYLAVSRIMFLGANAGDQDMTQRELETIADMISEFTAAPPQRRKIAAKMVEIFPPKN